MPNLGLDLQRNQIVGQTLAPLGRTATANGTGVDFWEAEGPVTAVISAGNLSNAVPDLAIALEDSSDNSTFAALSPVSSVTLAAADENAVQLLTTFARSNRYMRATYTHTGTALVNIVGVDLISKSKSY